MDFKISQIGNDTEEGRLIQRYVVTENRRGFLEIGEEKFVLPLHFQEKWEQINKFQVRDDDVFITGHPKTGTTWVNQMVNIILDDFNIDHKYHILYLDAPVVTNKQVFPTTEQINQANSPRSIRTHLPWFLLPEQIRNKCKSPKIIHCLRNPKDTCISFYHLQRTVHGYRGNFDDFCKLFLAGKLTYSPFFTTLRSFWEKRDEPNLLFIRYCDMKSDLAGMIRKTAAFLGKTPTDDQVSKMVDSLSFDNMRKHLGPQIDEMLRTESNPTPASSTFIRVGKEGGYKDVMSQELIEKFDALTKDKLSGTEIVLE